MEQKLLKMNTKEINSKISLRIRELFFDFLNKTTIHGLKNVKDANSHFIRFLWIIFIMFSASLCIYSITSGIFSYINYEVTTKTRYINENKSVFPTVSICNQNIFTSKYAYELLKNQSYITNQTHIFENPDLDHLNSNDLKYNTLAYFIKNEESVKDRMLLSYDFKDILISCKFNNHDCDESDFEWFYHFIYGNCFKFNKNGTKITRITGKSTGLSIEFYVGIYEKLNYMTKSNGGVVIISNKSEFSELDDGISLTPGFETNIIAKRTFINQLSKPYSNCEIQSNYNIDSFDSDLYKLMIENGLEYTFNDCIDLCYQKQVVQNCKCYDIESAALYRNVSPCFTSDQINCVNKIYNLVANDEHIESCYSSCPLECSKFKITNIISTSLYPPSDYYLNLIMRYMNSTKELKSDELENLREKILKINVYYDSLSYLQMTESPSGDIINLFSNIGGTLGLFIGMSVLSLSELIELLIKVMIICFKKILFSKKKQVKLMPSRTSKIDPKRHNLNIFELS